MNILFVIPFISNRIEISPHHGLACLIGYIRKMLPTVYIKVIDLNIDKSDIEQMEISKYDIIAFSFPTSGAPWVYEKTKWIKTMHPQITLIHGGVHATAEPESSLKNGADYVVRGEGELTTVALLHALIHKEEIGHIEGLSYTNDENYIHTPNRSFVSNLDVLAWPDWSDYSLEKYNHNLHVRKGFAFPIMASRGCQYACRFCCSPKLWRQKLRYRSVSNVLDEIAYNINRYGIMKFHFYDDDFFSNPQFVKEFCIGLKQRNIDIEYCIMARSNSINAHSELLFDLKESGCVMVEFGIENIDDEIMTSMSKNSSIKEITKTIELLDNYNIKAFYLLLFCLPGETLKNLYMTNRFLTQASGKHELTYGAYLTPFPGSAFFNDAHNKGLVIQTSYSHYIPINVCFIPFSILDEIPKIGGVLTEYDINFLIAGHIDIPKMFGWEHTAFMLRDFYDRINGVDNLHTIMKAFLSEHQLEVNEGYQFLYKFINSLAQLGFILAKKESYDIQEWYRKQYKTESKKVGIK